jgi:cobalt/nickel transport system permease protein
VKHSFIDKYGHLDSFVHQLDPRIKIIGLFSFILIIVSEPRGNIFPFLFYGLIIILLVAASRVPVGFILGRCLAVSPFILLAAAFYPLSSMITGGAGDTGTGSHEYMVAVSIILKAFSAIILLTILVSTSKFNDLLGGLRRLKMPGMVCIVLALMYRYIFILTDEALKTGIARESRTPGKLRLNKFRVYGNQFAMIFLRSMDRSQMIYHSMLSRGFTGQFPGMPQNKITAGEAALLTLFIVILLAVRLTNYGIGCFNNLIRF